MNIRYRTKSADEIKNQWGWTDFTSQQIKRSALMAHYIALIYNWWSRFVRAAHPKARSEAITSHPLLLNALGRKTEHAGQTKLIITPLHVAKDAAIGMLTNVHARLHQIREATAQLTKAERWRAIAGYIIEQIMACKPQYPLSRLPSPSG